MRTIQGLSGESRANKTIPSETSGTSAIGSNSLAEPKVTWRDQVKMVKKAFYNSNFQSAEGKKDPCTAEYCYARANTIAAMVAKSGSAEVLGWVEGAIKNNNGLLVSEDVSWDYHISAVVRENGKLYIADPLADNDIPLESKDDVAGWMTSSMGESMDNRVDYVFIPPAGGNFAGMNTSGFSAQTPSEIVNEIKKYNGEVLQADFVGTPAFNLGFMNMTKYRSAVVDQNLGVHEAKAVVEKNPTPVDNNFLWKKPFSLILPEKNDLRTSAVEHTPELKAVMRGLGLPFSERLKI